MSDNKQPRPVVVFTGQSWEAEMVKNILENEDIQAFINNEFVGTLVPFYTTPGMGAVKVVVSSENEDKAKALIANFENERFE